MDREFVYLDSQLGSRYILAFHAPFRDSPGFRALGQAAALHSTFLIKRYDAYELLLLNFGGRRLVKKLYEVLPG
jgi:hypothetical protein